MQSIGEEGMSFLVFSGLYRVWRITAPPLGCEDKDVAVQDSQSEKQEAVGIKNPPGMEAFLS